MHSKLDELLQEAKTLDLTLYPLLCDGWAWDRALSKEEVELIRNYLSLKHGIPTTKS